MADDTNTSSNRFVFPRWANYLLPVLVIGAVGGGLYVPVLMGLGLSADTLNVGYQPEQPVPYSHKVHVDENGLNCLHCHTTADDAAHANIPSTEVCINCHDPEETRNGIHKSSAKLEPIFRSYRGTTPEQEEAGVEPQPAGMPVEWVRVHNLPDFVYFNHAAHVNKGVSCLDCHGRVDKMEVVYQAKSLSMAWCLECHRNPEKFLRPKDKVTDMDWKATDHDWAREKGAESEEEAQLIVGKRLKEEYDIHDETYMTSCSTCHR